MDNWEKKALAYSKKEMLGLTQMLSKTVHDINNPLAVMIGQLSIFELMQQRGKLTEDKLEVIIEKLNKSSALFKERLDELRGFYKVSQNNEQFQSLDKILHAINYYFQNQTYTHHIELIIESEEDFTVDMAADDVLYCIKALVQNSIESLQNKEMEEKYIKIKTTSTDGKVLISVEDNGGGLISSDFTTALDWGQTTKDITHSGFGLSMVQMLLEQANSDLSYIKYDGEKTAIFSFTLPQKNA